MTRLENFATTTRPTQLGLTSATMADYVTAAKAASIHPETAKRELLLHLAADLLNATENRGLVEAVLKADKETYCGSQWDAEDATFAIEVLSALTRNACEYMQAYVDAGGAGQ